MASTTSYALTVDSGNKRHTFHGTGHFDMEWLTACLLLFKEYGVIIRNLAIHPDFRKLDQRHPLECCRCLNIVFDIPDQHACEFLNRFSKRLESIQWQT